MSSFARRADVYRRFVINSDCKKKNDARASILPSAFHTPQIRLNDIISKKKNVFVFCRLLTFSNTNEIGEKVMRDV